MNNRLLFSSLVLVASATSWTGCAKTETRNEALFGGSNSALTTASAGTRGEMGNSAMGSIAQPKKTTTTDRILSPLRSVKKTFTPQPVKSDAPPDPISLANSTTSPSPELFLSAARVIASSGKHDGAQSLYEQALVADPGNREAMLELARIYVQQDQPNKARDIYLKAVELHPQDPIVFNDLGLFHLQSEDAEMGIKAFQRAVQLDPKRTLYRNNLANAFVISGRTDLALDQLMAVQAKPVAHFNLGYLLASHQKYLPAIEQFDLAFQEDDQFYDAYVMKKRLIAELEKSQGQTPESFVRPVSYESDLEAESGSNSKVATAPALVNDRAKQRSSSSTQPTRSRSNSHRATTNPQTANPQTTNPQTAMPTPASSRERIGSKPVIERTPEGADATEHQASESLAEPRVFNLSDQEAADMQPVSKASQPTAGNIQQVGYDAEVAVGSAEDAPSASIRLADFEAPVETDLVTPEASLANYSLETADQAQQPKSRTWADRLWNRSSDGAEPNTEQVGEMRYPVTDAPRLLGTPHVDAHIKDAKIKDASPANTFPPRSLHANDIQDAKQALDTRMLISPSQYLGSQSVPR